MKRVLTYLKVYLRIFAASIMMVSTYNVDFLFWTVVHALELVITIVFFNAIFLRTPVVGEWNIYQVIVLVGYINLLMGFGGLTFFPMMYEFKDVVRKGELDWKITKPIDVQFLVSFPWIDVWDFVFIPQGLLAMGYGLSRLGGFHFINHGLPFVVLTACSMVIIYSLATMGLSLVFRYVRLETVDHLIWTMLHLGKYPVSVFKGISYFILMFIIPIGLIATVPVKAIVGLLEGKDLLISLVFAASLFFLSRKIFFSNLRYYTSASS